jgi:hypothetical protein
VNEPIVVISAEIAGLDYHANLERTNELRYELLKLGYSIVGIKQVKDGKSLQSFIVVTNDPDDLVPLAKKFGQKSVLISDLSRKTYELSTDNVEELTHFGKLYPASKEAALQQKYYLTFTEDGKDHFYITGEQTDEKTA